jgi:hypothetical protein
MKIIQSIRLPILLATLGSLSACQFHARSPEKYRDDTRAVLETRSAQIASCYDSALAQDASASGQVVVQFFVEEKTGKIHDAEVLPASTAPPALGQCVVDALDGLTLDPPDQRLGDATFTWAFSPS